MEFYEEIWRKSILIPQNIIDAMELKKNVNTGKLSKFEKEKIKEKLECMINDGDIRNAVYIYINREANNENRLSVGIGTILLIRKTVHDNIFFDINKAILIPIIELISCRMDSVLENHAVNTSFPHICWIPIYYINSKAVMIPVIRKCDSSLMTKSEGEIIIINPFI
ncbi:hypothetical protein CH64_1536 [Yersinia rohdei]|uniref:Uncharacterized protein n=1 Tax=Yersinia rohdei TaxID=29485 RepID=A0ABM5SFL2_YERRO|nr:hypothetical protein [Yersinia rohdei]AJJ11932.1 hypothetical protein CH64_1536 [Yersinia rohdei]